MCVFVFISNRMSGGVEKNKKHLKVLQTFSTQNKHKTGLIALKFMIRQAALALRHCSNW